MRMPWERLPKFISEAVADKENVYEIRIRESQPIEVCRESGNALAGDIITKEQIKQTVSSLTGHSVYAWESQISQGFFTLPEGARVGLAGRFEREGREIQHISSLCVRIPRDISSKSRDVLGVITANGRVGSCLILSPPGLGKTTLLRSLIKAASEMGLHVSVCDERDELSGGKSLGPRVDTAANCPKSIAIPMLVRAMSPDIVATDEIGGPGDAEVIADAKRCGCEVLATAHAEGYVAARERKTLKPVTQGDIFDFFLELGPGVGHVSRILAKGGQELWTDGR